MISLVGFGYYGFVKAEAAGPTPTYPTAGRPVAVLHRVARVVAVDLDLTTDRDAHLRVAAVIGLA